MADSGIVLGGPCTLTIDGHVYECEGDVTCTLPGLSAEAVVGNRQIAGVRTTPVPGSIKATVILTPSDKVSTLSELRGVSVSVECATRAFTFTNAWTSAPCESSSNGTASLEMMASKGQEIT